ncbi:hypothetical protein Tdes44962_MAKER07215 [Teratosphaeria destructans]|uniref:Uncharacterized protein n=1 Tax=Teratosphaeria destructans TaxID=418781 RepID=A0A9W7SZP3_9PEZI|nr:hypothetical protein Tdes44962_MAKER07215 [Teratosphaeria destructans]
MSNLPIFTTSFLGRSPSSSFSTLSASTKATAILLRDFLDPNTNILTAVALPRGPGPDRLALGCIIRGGVLFMFCSSTYGELFCTIIKPGATLLLLANLFRRRASFACSRLGSDDDGTGASASSALVTFGNLIAGQGSPSESPTSMSRN